MTDCHSHKIAGRSLSSPLSAFFTLKALRTAVAQTGRDNPEGLVHHSDRGIQYCCDLYVGEFQKHHIAIGMMEDYLPTDNAMAERVNGTIKTERVYVRPQRFRDRQDAERQIAEFIRLLQQPSAAYEHRHADSRNGLSPAGRTTEMPETEKIRRKDEMVAESFFTLPSETTKIE